LGSLSTN
jgi:hypothetical protein